MLYLSKFPSSKCINAIHHDILQGPGIIVFSVTAPFGATAVYEASTEGLSLTSGSLEMVSQVVWRAMI